MKTPIDIPEALLLEVMEITKAKTKRQAVILALEDMITVAKRKRLIAMKGTIDLGIDLDSLRGRK